MIMPFFSRQLLRNDKIPKVYTVLANAACYEDDADIFFFGINP